MPTGNNNILQRRANKLPNKTETDALLLEQVNKSKARCEYDTTDNQKRYKEAYLYYEGKLPAPYDVGLAPMKNKASRTQYVEMVLKESERKLTPAILAIFTENASEAVRFVGKGFKRDALIDDVINTEINNIFLRQNDGYAVLENIIKDCLITGNGFGKIFVDEKIEHDKMPLDGWHKFEDVIASLQNSFDDFTNTWKLDFPPEITKEKKGKYKGMEWKQQKDAVSVDPNTGKPITVPVLYITGNCPIYKINKKVIPQYVDFKDLVFDTSCGSDFDACRYICHKRIITVGEAVEMGFSEELVKDASTANELSQAALSRRNLLTNGQFDGDYNHNDYSSDPYERKISLFEHYTYSSIPTGKTKFYQILATENEILEWKEIPEHPFVNFRFDIIPGSFWGHGLYDTCKHYQDILSDFTRVAVQKSIKAAYPSYIAMKGQYDRESLLNSTRPGGIIELTAMGTVEIMPELQMPQEFYSIMQYLTNSLEKKTSTSVGALADANGDMPENVSAQSIGMMVANEGLKDKVGAKAIARTGVRPFFEKLYKIIKGEGLQIITTQGVITSDQFPSLYEFEIDINTSADKLMQSKQLASAYQVIAQVAQVQSPVFGPSNLAAAGAQLLDGSDLDATKFFTDPTANVSPEQIQQQQQDEQDAKILQKNAQLLSYQSAIAEYQKTLAEIAKIEAETDEHIKDGHAKREIHFNDSLLKAQHHQTEQIKAASDAKFKQDKISLDDKAINTETILKTAELHQKGSTNTDVNGVGIQ